MKTRIGFVSNSSSASFILDKRYLTEEQQGLIKKLVEECYDGWRIDEDDDFIRGFTVMDNGYLFDAIKEQVNPQLKAIVEWE